MAKSESRFRIRPKIDEAQLEEAARRIEKRLGLAGKAGGREMAKGMEEAAAKAGKRIKQEAEGVERSLRRAMGVHDPDKLLLRMQGVLRAFHLQTKGLASTAPEGYAKAVERVAKAFKEFSTAKGIPEVTMEMELGPYIEKMEASAQKGLKLHEEVERKRVAASRRADAQRVSSSEAADRRILESGKVTFDKLSAYQKKGKRFTEHAVMVGGERTQFRLRGKGGMYEIVDAADEVRKVLGKFHFSTARKEAADFTRELMKQGKVAALSQAEITETVVSSSKTRKKAVSEELSEEVQARRKAARERVKQQLGQEQAVRQSEGRMASAKKDAARKDRKAWEDAIAERRKVMEALQQASPRGRG